MIFSNHENLYILYIFCGLTDMVDGKIARKTGTTSTFGARLDTVADLVFLLVCGIRILPRINLIPIVYSASIVCVFATVAAAQEIYFIAKGQEML